MSSWKDKSEKQVPRDIPSWLLANCFIMFQAKVLAYCQPPVGWQRATCWQPVGDPLVTKSCAEQKSSWKGKSEEQFPKDNFGRLLADC